MYIGQRTVLAAFKTFVVSAFETGYFGISVTFLFSEKSVVLAIF